MFDNFCWKSGVIGAAVGVLAVSLTNLVVGYATKKYIEHKVGEMADALNNTEAQAAEA